MNIEYSEIFQVKNEMLQLSGIKQCCSLAGTDLLFIYLFIYLFKEEKHSLPDPFRQTFV